MAAIVILAASLTGSAQTDRRLIDAVKKGNREAARSLAKQRTLVNVLDTDGTSPLHWAVRADDLDMARLLLAAGANPKTTDRYGITPIFLAAENGREPMLRLLLDAGASANDTLPNGQTVLMTAARTGDAATIKALLTAGADANSKERRFGETALMWAAGENNAAAIRVLAAAGADTNARSSELQFPEFKFITSGMVTTALPRGGWTPLMHAARQGSVDAAAALADAKADLNVTDPEGSTALVIAIINAHFDLAAVLLDKGADPNVPDSTGMTALYAAVDMHTLGPMLSRPGPKVVDKLDAAELVKILLEKGANPNIKLKRPIIGRHHDSGDASLGEGTTPLMRAAKTVDLEVMRLLLDGGADATITQKDYSTAAMIVAAGGRGGAAPEASVIEGVRLCLERGVDVDAFNAAGQTVLHVAAQRGSQGLIRFLAERGAKLDMKNRQGRSPLDLVTAAPGGPGGRGGGGGAAAGPANAANREATAALLRELIAQRNN